MKTAIVSGVIANKLHNGGAAWTRLSWANGLQQLGYRVIFIEQIAPQHCVDDSGRVCNFRSSANLLHFQQVTEAHGLAGVSSLICGTGEDVAGLSMDALSTATSQADFLLNISGHLSLASLFDKARHRIYLDLDPGYTQHWHVQGHLPDLLAHHHFFTVGLNIGTPECNIPTSGVNWQAILQPVVLEDWPMMPIAACNRFSTIASWRGPFGAIDSHGMRLGPKAHEFRKYVDLPRQLIQIDGGLEMEIALQMDPADSSDRNALTAGGWIITDPKTAAGNPSGFRSYIQQSAGEFSVSQGIYVQTNSGWFSDRTVRYLASGKPAVVQETGFSNRLPVGEGLISFSTPEQALAGLQRVKNDYSAHCRAARAIAEKYFDAKVVLSGLIDRIH